MPPRVILSNAKDLPFHLAPGPNPNPRDARLTTRDYIQYANPIPHPVAAGER